MIKVKYFNDETVIICKLSVMQQVRWDEDTVTNHQDRVSPWEIDLSSPQPPLSIQSSPRLKKPRTGLLVASPNHLITGMNPNGEIECLLLLNFMYQGLFGSYFRSIMLLNRLNVFLGLSIESEMLELLYYKNKIKLMNDFSS